MTDSSRDYYQALLCLASNVLRAQQPKWQVSFKKHDSHGIDRPVTLHARFDWPGVVSVHSVETGELLVRSLPGQPFSVDNTARAAATAPDAQR